MTAELKKGLETILKLDAKSVQIDTAS